MIIPNFKFFKKIDNSPIRSLLFKGLAIVYFMALLSLLSQFDGLFSSKGILPISSYISYLISILGDDYISKVPTLFYVYSGDVFIKLCLVFGLVCSVILFLGRAPFYMLLSLWVLYLSVVNVGQAFLSFQWDILLIEVGFIAILMAPIKIGQFDFNRTVPKVVIWALRLVLFRVMISSALVKWGSNDLNWQNFTALDYHYWTQPLPHILAFYVEKLPHWIHKGSVIVMLLIEAVVPFLIFFGRKGRLTAAILFTILMECVFWTGNYGFFNILIVVMCISLFDEPDHVKNNDSKLLFFKLSKTIIPCSLIVLGLSLELARFTP
ncbi:hypothetical protein DID80_03535 [Candidatus Marinamargulisbacteria bacterium SCGC AAA071-K20]|nr:hypothetical protein DID80_03535 [Candidatus Marinamargulisbacteria bacterium SCGC AAA071-K20]